jgi:hypothetical protein
MYKCMLLYDKKKILGKKLKSKIVYLYFMYFFSQYFFRRYKWKMNFEDAIFWLHTWPTISVSCHVGLNYAMHQWCPNLIGLYNNLWHGHWIGLQIQQSIALIKWLQVFRCSNMKTSNFKWASNFQFFHCMDIFLTFFA